ncbi:glycosyltransferase [Porphyrobacter sp. SLTP]|jgi:predicted glycosyltransferase|uniref:glycosyltransferase n=1 Tax=Porphyrobacter sp. SLTP TaxID=2683266 RepID=UPI001412CC77|nr:glycosyltransferase [Porphyrobacter sp. SLTP]NBB24654.1 glycosyltransferase [Porphyrobacter sp. SLTP]
MIGYYIHHQGEGHRQRAAAIAAAYRGPMTLIGTGLGARLNGIPCLDLPDDRLPHGQFDGRDKAIRPPALHYAPLHHTGVRERVALIANWIAEAQPDLMIVDVSVEVAMLARLASVPVAYVRLSGRRSDPPHCDAFASAQALLAPFAEPLDDMEIPEWVKQKTFYANGIIPTGIARSVDPTRVLVVAGRGGEAADGARWAAAAAAVPDRTWRVIGPSVVPARIPENLEFAGWVDGADAEIASAGVVIGAAGDGLVSAVLAHERPFICFPEPRAFDEQAVKAERLAALGAAVVPAIWPEAEQWRMLIAAAERQPSQRPAALRVRDGAERVARWLEQLTQAPQALREARS